MAFRFAPAIYVAGYGGALPNPYILPQPIVQADLNYNWEGKNHKTPRKAGGQTYGTALNPIQINIQGSVDWDITSAPEGSPQSGSVIATEEDMWDVWTDINAILASLTDTAGAEFFMWYDPGGLGTPPSSATYRKFKKVYPDQGVFNFGDGNHSSFGFSLALHADDTTVYTTGPGS